MISPEGRHLLSCDKQGTLRLWDLTEQRLVMTTSEPGFKASAFAFSRDGARLALTLQDGDGGSSVNVWAIATQQMVAEFRHDRAIQAIIFTQDDTALLTVDREMAVHAWAFDGQSLQPQWPDRTEPLAQCRRAVFSPDGKTIAMIDLGGHIRLFDVLTGSEKMQMDAFEGDIASLAFSPDGGRLAVSPLYMGLSTDIKVFSTETGEETLVLAGHGSWIPAVTFTQDGQRIISAGADQTIRIWRASDGQELTRLHGHLSEIYCVTVSPDGNHIVSGCKDGTLFGWDLAEMKHQLPFETLPVPVISLDFLPGRAGILSVNADGTVTLWDQDTLQEEASLDALGDNIHRLLVSPDGRTVMASTWQGQLKVLDLTTRRMTRELVCDPNHRAPVDLVGLRDEGQSLVVVTSDSELRLFDTLSWQSESVSVPPRARQYAPSPILSPDERFVLYVGYNETIHLVDLQTGDTETIPTHQTWSVLDMAFSPTSDLFATSSGEGIVSLWDGGRRKVVDVLQGHLLGVHAVAFSPDGQRLASGSKGAEAIKLWDITTRHEVATLPGEGFLSSQLKFSPDGRLLGAVNFKGKAHIWRAPSLRDIEEAERDRVNESGFRRH